MRQVKRMGWIVASGLSVALMAGCSGAEDLDSQTMSQTEPLTSEPAVLANTAPKDREHRGPGHMIERFDANKNGTLELSELPEHKRERMAAADVDKNGTLTLDEMKAFHESRPKGDKRHGKGDFKQLDVNKNGTLEVAELPERMKEKLAKADANSDGVLSKDEMVAHRATFEAERFTKKDTNKDGALTLDEIGQDRWARLGVADADKDGRVTQAELKQARESGVLKLDHRGSRGRGPREHR